MFPAATDSSENPSSIKSSSEISSSTLEFAESLESSEMLKSSSDFSLDSESSIIWSSLISDWIESSAGSSIEKSSRLTSPAAVSPVSSIGLSIESSSSETDVSSGISIEKASRLVSAISPSVEISFEVSEKLLSSKESDEISLKSKSFVSKFSGASTCSTVTFPKSVILASSSVLRVESKSSLKVSSLLNSEENWLSSLNISEKSESLKSGRSKEESSVGISSVRESWSVSWFSVDVPSSFLEFFTQTP